MRRHWYTITAVLGGLIGFFLPLFIDYMSYDGSDSTSISWLDYGDRDYPKQNITVARNLLEQLWFLCWLQRRGSVAIIISTSVALAISLPLYLTGVVERMLAERDKKSQLADGQQLSA